jgi:hypothetical protein
MVNNTTNNTAINSIHNTNNITNHITNITNNITINVFGSEDIAHIVGDKKRMNGYIQHCFMGIPMLIRDVHFYPAHPENHTVRMPNRRDKFL